jgi:hypothetical protein
MTTVRNSSPKSRLVWVLLTLLILLALLLVPALSYAHPRDELEQATYLEILPKHVTIEVNLAPGDIIASDFASLLDTDHDGKMTESEQSAFANQLLSNLLLSIDGTALPLQIKTSQFPPIESLKNGEERIRLTFDSPISSLSAGKHTLRYENRYTLPKIKSGYLATTLAGEQGIEVGTQTRDATQKVIDVEFLAPATSNFASLGIVAIFFALIGTWLWTRIRHQKMRNFSKRPQSPNR